MKKLIRVIAVLSVVILSSFSSKPERENYQLKIFTLENSAQEMQMDSYLEKALIPALHKVGIDKVGVFKTIEGKNDGQKLIVLFVPLNSISQFNEIQKNIDELKTYQEAAKDYINAPYDNPPYQRFESILLESFSGYPKNQIPKLNSEKSDRVYELRSYESATEKIHKQKVKMFNSGEIDVFTDLGFQPMFFARVISGSHMPNLMYMTCHENEEAQASNWKAFGEHPTWMKLKGMEEYKNTVSHIDKLLLYPAEYSDY